MKKLLLCAAAALTQVAHAADPACDTPEVVSTVKMIYAENIIAAAERELAARQSLDRATPQSAIDAAERKLTAAVRLLNVRRIDVEQTAGFPTWCAADAMPADGPAYPISMQYRARPSPEHPGGMHVQAKATMPPGREGFNSLIALRGHLASLVRRGAS